MAEEHLINDANDVLKKQETMIGHLKKHKRGDQNEWQIVIELTNQQASLETASKDIGKFNKSKFLKRQVI